MIRHTLKKGYSYVYLQKHTLVHLAITNNTQLWYYQKVSLFIFNVNNLGVFSRHGHRSKKFLAATYMKQYDMKRK